MTALWGPSGSGKSTMLSLLGLLMRPTTGTVRLDGDNAWRSGRIARELRATRFGWVLQNLASIEARTALENTRLPLLARGMIESEADDQATSALETVGLRHRASARSSELSGGELQRMTIARMICQGLPILLADEPTGQLDKASSDEVAATFALLAQAGRCVIIATHDERLAASCQRVIGFANGQIEEH
jgi:putative ABC transport system ATP-binding protein